MSIENDLLQLARRREDQTDAALLANLVDRPDSLLRQIRAYLARQADRGRMKRTNEKIVQLDTVEGGLNHVACPEMRLSSGTRVHFDIELEPSQTACLTAHYFSNPSPSKVAWYNSSKVVSVRIVGVFAPSKHASEGL